MTDSGTVRSDARDRQQYPAEKGHRQEVTRDGETDSEVRPKKGSSTRKKGRVESWPLIVAVATRLGDPRQSPRTQLGGALCHQRVVKMTGLTKSGGSRGGE